ncbi:hypothetical protein PsorP6_007481 [Peronosclerospora sorghi]|uniref:Uncharacterized protein n=1 Tax=Peronosclerospora sorghi TaxID=230839 RepID=A0ACC0WDV6_9STRA|nr:hypothetical protein PsorP6_007481 [Peronosclerospora sorghi]
MVSIEKEALRTSADTEIIDHVYMLDFQNVFDSDDDSHFGNVYVAPPVNIPGKYQKQDRLGGVKVAGVRVLFTYAGFQRRKMLIRKLETISEGGELVLLPTRWKREGIVIRNVLYSGEQRQRPNRRVI